MSRFVTHRGLTLAALALTVVAVAGACEARASTAGVAASQPAQLSAVTTSASIHALVADLRVAQERHDTRAVHRIHARIGALLGATAARDAQASYRSALANLVAADAANDPQARARYRAQLRVLCDPAGVTGALLSCDTALAAQGD